jgi:hypothetical protein
MLHLPEIPENTPEMWRAIPYLSHYNREQVLEFLLDAMFDFAQSELMLSGGDKVLDQRLGFYMSLRLMCDTYPREESLTKNP